MRLTVVPGGRARPDARDDEPRPGRRRPATARPTRPETADRSQRADHGADADAGPTGRVRRLLGRGRLPALVLLLVLLGVAAMVIAQPLRQWRDQQNDISVAERRLEEVRAERELVQELTEELRSDASIRQHARELLDMVDPGEDLVVVLPPGSTDLGLPDAWPFTGVERELGTG